MGVIVGRLGGCFGLLGWSWGGLGSSWGVLVVAFSEDIKKQKKTKNNQKPDAGFYRESHNENQIFIF